MGQILLDGGDVAGEEGLRFPDGIQDDGVDDRIILVNKRFLSPAEGASASASSRDSTPWSASFRKPW
jgi:hypothetical protein